MKWHKIPLIFVAVHTAILLLTAIAMLVGENSHNPDSTIGFAMMCITFYVIDFPIGLLLEACRPHFSNWGGWLPTVLFLYGVLGNLMWFVLGTLAYFCTQRDKIRSAGRRG